MWLIISWLDRTEYVSNTQTWKYCKRYGKRPTGPLRPSYLERGPGHARPLDPRVHFLSKVSDVPNVDRIRRSILETSAATFSA